MKNRITKSTKIENPVSIWLPEATRFGNILRSNQITYAIFGAGALAAHNILTRPTIDIDFVVKEYPKAVSLISGQPDLKSKAVEDDKDGISVADFHFKSGVSVEIWDQNLYSLPMNDFSWSRTVLRDIPGSGTLVSVSPEDIIVSKIGRFHQQKNKNETTEADKTIKDILATIIFLQKPDYKYIIERMKEGARRESSKSSHIRNLNWFFVREVEDYRQKLNGFKYEKVSNFVSHLLSSIRSQEVEYYLLHRLRKEKSIGKFQTRFMLNDKSLSILLKRWNFIDVSDDNITLTSRTIDAYIKRLTNTKHSEYYEKILCTKKSSLKA